MDKTKHLAELSYQAQRASLVIDKAHQLSGSILSQVQVAVKAVDTNHAETELNKLTGMIDVALVVLP